jgi:hypothetical protein
VQYAGGLRGWGGTTLRATGIVEGGFEHGFTMMDEHCTRGGKLVVTGETVNGHRMLKRLGMIGQSLGLTRMDVEARIETLDGAAPNLRVTRYYGSLFEPMSEHQLSEFDRKRGR